MQLNGITLTECNFNFSLSNTDIFFKLYLTSFVCHPVMACDVIKSLNLMTVMFNIDYTPKQKDKSNYAQMK